MDIGLVGLPNAGKSTLFNAVTGSSAPTANYAFTTIEPNIAVVSVPDPRLEQLAGVIRPDELVPAVIRFVDIAGLVKGASEGEGLGNQFLGHIREVDTIVQVVRCFEEGVPHAPGELGPTDDIETINVELALADLATCTKRQQRLRKPAKSGDPAAKDLSQKLEGLIELLSEGGLAANFPFADDFADLHLLTAKPMIFVANINEDDFRAQNYEPAREVEEYAAAHNCDMLVVSAKIEAELAELEPDEAADFRSELASEHSSVDTLITAAYHTLDLITFFTAGPNECRAWPVKSGSLAVEAAGRIHTDFATKFVKAEVIHLDELVAAGSYASARDNGKLRIEGRSYAVKDGDILLFKI